MANAKLKSVFLPRDKDRLILILALIVMYPVFIGCLFVLLLFWILPVLLPPVPTPLVANPAFWLHCYWAIAAAVWLLLLAVLMPLMQPVADDGTKKAVTYKRGSGVSIKEESELTPLSKDIKKVSDDKANGVGVALTTYDADGESVHSLDKSLLGRSSQDNLKPVDSQDAITTSNPKLSASQYGLETQSTNSLKRSSPSLAERQKLTQSGEFLSDCMDNFNSEDDVHGEIIKGNTNCQVHAQEAQFDESDTEIDEPPLDSSRKDSDTDSCKEPLHEKLDRSTFHQPSHYAEVEKTEQLVRKESAPINEAINEAMVVADKDNCNQAERSSPTREVAESVQQTEAAPEQDLEELQPRIRQASHALPKIDTSRASQGDCYAPISMSPRESKNVVFLYVNPDKE